MRAVEKLATSAINPHWLTSSSTYVARVVPSQEVFSVCQLPSNMSSYLVPTVVQASISLFIQYTLSLLLEVEMENPRYPLVPDGSMPYCTNTMCCSKVWVALKSSEMV